MPAYDRALEPAIPKAVVIAAIPGDKSLSLNVEMWMDTGADITLLPRHIIDKLLERQKLKYDWFEIEGFSTDGRKRMRAYYVSIQLEGCEPITVPVVYSNTTIGYLGRDVLNNFAVCINGTEETWCIAQNNPCSVGDDGAPV